MFIGQRIMKYKEPVVGIEPTANALRKHCSTAELHRLIDCCEYIINKLVAHWTLAIIPFAYYPCQALIHPFSCILTGYCETVRYAPPTKQARLRARPGEEATLRNSPL